MSRVCFGAALAKSLMQGHVAKASIDDGDCVLAFVYGMLTGFLQGASKDMMAKIGLDAVTTCDLISISFSQQESLIRTGMQY